MIPLLDAIKEGEKYIGVFKRNIEEVGEAYNKIGASDVSLLKELHAMITLLNNEYGDELIEVPSEFKRDLFQKVASNENIIDSIKSIIFDESYFQWVQTFVPTGKEQDYLEKVVMPDEVEDIELCTEVITNFILALIDKNHELLSQVLLTTSNSVMQARIECKDILIALSAISHKLVMNNNSETLEHVIEQYNAERYFGRDITIR